MKQLIYKNFASMLYQMMNHGIKFECNPDEDEPDLWFKITMEDALAEKADGYNHKFRVHKNDVAKYELRKGDIGLYKISKNVTVLREVRDANYIFAEQNMLLFSNGDMIKPDNPDFTHFIRKGKLWIPPCEILA